MEDNALHVVGQNVLGDAHVRKAVDHPDEQVLLLGVGKELHIHLAAVMADHGEACYSRFVAIRIDNMCESPVHLVRFSRK